MALAHQVALLPETCLAPPALQKRVNLDIGEGVAAISNNKRVGKVFFCSQGSATTLGPAGTFGTAGQGEAP